MASVDSRIVTMKFENRDFQKGVDNTILSLGKLSKVLDGGFTSKAFSSLGSIASHFDLSNMGSQVEGLSGRFLALGTVAVTALSRITNSAIDAGLGFAKQFSGLQGAISGFHEYETQLGSIQTILANTTGANLDDVNNALNQLNHYSDKTIYNFEEMARNIGTFTAAGVGLQDSVTSIKGIANLAALSGSSSAQASSAMYQLSQAIAAGRVSLMDWNSVVNAGMGGKVFQQALIHTGEAMGVINENAVKLNKTTGQLTVNGESFRESIGGGDSWLNSKILTNTLAQFSGDLTDAQLKSQGFTEAQIKDIRKMAKEAENAATKVKTFTQLLGTIKETIGSGWTKTWQLVLGDFTEAKKLWTGVNNTVSGFFTKLANRRNRVLQAWADAGGRDDLLKSFRNLFDAFINIIRPIRNAFHDIFPRATGEQLAKITAAFKRFTRELVVGKKTSGEIRDVFRGIFSVFKIILIVIGAAIKYVAEFFGILVSGGGGSAILAIAAALGRVVTAVQEWLTEGGRLQKFFDNLIAARNAVLKPLVGTIGAVVEAFVALLSGDVTGFFDKMGEAGGHLVDLFDLIKERLGSLGDYFAMIFGALATYFAGLGTDIGNTLANVFGTISSAIHSAVSALSFGGGGGPSLGIDSGPIDDATKKLDKLSWVANAAKGIWNGLKKSLTTVGSALAPILPAVGRVFAGVLDVVANTLQGADLNDILQIINTAIFGKMAWNIGSFFDVLKEGVKLKTSIKGTFDQLTNTLKTLQGSVKYFVLKQIAVSVALLAGSMVLLSLIPKDKMKGAMIALGEVVTAVGGLMVIMGKMKGEWPAIAAMGPAMIAISFAMTIMAGALMLFDKVNVTSILKMVGVLAALALTMRALGAFPATMLAAGAAFMMIAPAMIILAGALMLFDKVNWSSMIKAGTSMAFIAIVLGLMGDAAPTAVIAAAAFFILAPSLVILAQALQMFNKVDWGSVFKMIVAVGALAITLSLMSAALPGAYAIGLVAIALNLLIAPLKALAEMSWGDILGAFGKLGVGLAILGVTAGLLSPVLLILGAALVLIGAGLLMAGAGMALFGVGLTLVAASGTAAFAALVAGITTFLTMLPNWIKQGQESVIAFANMMRKSSPAMIRAFVAIIRALIQAVIKLNPQFRHLAVTLILNFLAGVRQTFPSIVQTGFQMVMNILNGLDKHMDRMVDKGVDVAVKFMNGISRNANKLAEAGRKMVESVATAVGLQLLVAGIHFLQAAQDAARQLIAGLVSGIGAGISSVANAIGNLASNAISSVKDKLGIGGPSREMIYVGRHVVEGFQRGIEGSSRDAVKATDKMGTTVLDALTKTMAEAQQVAMESLDVNPTITPVLDLSQVARESGRLGAMLGATQLNAGVSYGRAVDISNQNEQLRSAQAEAAAGPTEIKFEQNNTSPKALSPIEIYRNTKSLFAMAEEALASS